MTCDELRRRIGEGLYLSEPLFGEPEAVVKAAQAHVTQCQECQGVARLAAAGWLRREEHHLAGARAAERRAEETLREARAKHAKAKSQLEEGRREIQAGDLVAYRDSKGRWRKGVVASALPFRPGTFSVRQEREADGRRFPAVRRFDSELTPLKLFDSTDANVYADWLEEQGEGVAAAKLRAAFPLRLPGPADPGGAATEPAPPPQGPCEVSQP